MPWEAETDEESEETLNDGAKNFLDEEGDIRYPNLTVTLIGENGNALNLIGIVARAMRRAKISSEEVDKFREEAMSGDYDNVLRTCMRWVDVQ